MPCDGVDQRAVEIADSRMDNHPGRLVDDHQLVVFIDHVEGDVLGFNGCIVVRTVKHQRDDISRAHLIVALDGLSVDLYEAGVCRFLDAVARGVLNVFRHVFVNTHRHLSAVHFHAKVLIQFLTLAVEVF